MEFGHLRDLREVDFSLPVDDPRSVRVLGGLPRGDARARVGLPVWTDKAWVGKIFPRGTAARDYLKEYANQFGSVELNSSHYAIPDAGMLDRWRQAVGPEFRFCPKILQEISHDLARGDLARLSSDFFMALEQLGPARGAYFLQLPPYFGPDRLALLKKFFSYVPTSAQLVVEFRHPDWFAKGRLIDTAFDALSESGVGTVISDVAGRRDVSHASLTAPFVMVRFVGNEGHPTDEPRVREWSSRLARWFEQGLEELYFFVHQPDNTGSPELAAVFIEEMRRKCGVPGFDSLKRWDQPDQLALL